MRGPFVRLPPPCPVVNLLPAMIGRSEIRRRLALESIGSSFGVAGLRLRLAGSFDPEDLSAMHGLAAVMVERVGHDPDAYALVDRGPTIDLLVPERPCKDDYDRSTALAALGLDPHAFWG